MQSSTTRPGRLGLILGRWRSMSRLRRLILIALAASLTAWGLIEAHRWWTAWPARLVLRTDGGHLPMKFTPDGAALLTRPFDQGSLLLWDSKDGRKLATWEGRKLATWQGPLGRTRFRGVFSPDGRTFASAWFAGKATTTFAVDLIDVETGQVRSSFGAPAGGWLGLSFREEGRVVRLVATSGLKRAVQDVDVASGRVLAPRALSAPTGPEVSAVSPDCRLLAGINLTGPHVIRVWDLDDDREVMAAPGVTNLPTAITMAFTPDNRKLAIGFDDGTIEIWDLASKSLVKTLRDHSANYGPRHLEFSPDGSTLSSMGAFNKHVPSLDLLKVVFASMTGDTDHVMQTELILLDVSSGRRLLFAKEAQLVVFSPDGKSIAASHTDGTVQIHDVPKLP